MRDRTQIEAEAKALGRVATESFDRYAELTRKDMIFLEVLLDIRDGLYENESRPTAGITQ